MKTRSLTFNPHKLIIECKRDAEALVQHWDRMRNSLEAIETAGRMLSGCSNNPRLEHLQRRAERILQLLRETSPGSFGLMPHGSWKMCGARSLTTDLT